MKEDDNTKNYDYSGLKNKVIFIHFFSILILFSSTLAIIFFFGSGLTNIFKYSVFMLIVLIVFQMTIVFYLRVIEKKIFHGWFIVSKVY